MNDDDPVLEFGGRVCPRRFSSRLEYEKLLRSLESDDSTEEVPVLMPATNVGLNERWFRDKATHQILRVIEPDAPFPGRCELVDSVQDNQQG